MSKQLGLSLLLLIIVTASACRPQAAVPTLAPTIDASTPEAEESQEGDLGAVDERRTEAKAAERPDEESTASEGKNELEDGSDEQTGLRDREPVAVQANPQDEDPKIAFEYADIELRWLGVSDGIGPNELVVQDPSLYTVEFSTDGNFVYQANCNIGRGAFVQVGKQLSLDLGAVALAVCSDDSLADQYIQYLREVVSFDSSLDRLKFELAGGAKQMIFSQELSVAPELAEVAILDIDWFWIAFSDPAEGQLSIEEPRDYSFALLPDGIVQVKADCNETEGSYSLEGSALSITTEETTSEDCRPDSNWDSFVRYLNGAALYFVQNDDLFIDLIYDSGTMRFENGDSIGG